MSLVGVRIGVDDSVIPPVGHPRKVDSLTLPTFVPMDRRGIFSYSMLPEEPIKLSVLKLDGSTFEVEVMQSATIAELRQAVEDAFSHMPKDGPDKISWPHVWGHFCLMYNGQKLVTETEYISYHGIRDGDQLQFVRHVSSSYDNNKKGSIKRLLSLQPNRTSISRSSREEEEEENDNRNRYSFGLESGKYQQHYDALESNNALSNYRGSSSPRLFRWWSYSKVPTSERTASLGDSPSPSPRSDGFLDNFRKMIPFCCSSSFSSRGAWIHD